MSEFNDLVLKNAKDAHQMFLGTQTENSKDDAWIERKMLKYADFDKIPGIWIEERTWWKLLMSYGVT